MPVVEEPPSTHSEPEEPVSPAHVPSPTREKVTRKKAPKPPKPPKMPKAPKPPKVPKVKEGGKKKGKKAKEASPPPPPPPKPSSFAALESHAKDILSKMDQPKKGKVCVESLQYTALLYRSLRYCLSLCQEREMFASEMWYVFSLTRKCHRVFCLHFQAVKNVLSVSEKETSKQNNVEKFEMREQNKNKTEAKWKYKVR